MPAKALLADPPTAKSNSESFNNAIAQLHSVHQQEVAALEHQVRKLHRQIEQLTLNGTRLPKSPSPQQSTGSTVASLSMTPEAPYRSPAVKWTAQGTVNSRSYTKGDRVAEERVKLLSEHQFKVDDGPQNGPIRSPPSSPPRGLSPATPKQYINRTARVSAPCVSLSKPQDVLLQVGSEPDYCGEPFTVGNDWTSVQEEPTLHDPPWRSDKDKSDTTFIPQTPPIRKHVSYAAVEDHGSHAVQSFVLNDMQEDEDTSTSVDDKDRNTAIPSDSRLIDRWGMFVDRLLRAAATKRQYALREDWIRPEAFMKKLEKTHGELDLGVLNGHHNGKIGGARTRATMFGKFTAGLPHSSSALHSPASLLLDVSSHRFCMIHPASHFRICWLGLGMLLVAYDMVVLPLSAFPLPDSSILTSMQWIGQFFWTIDILVTFCTAIYQDGELVSDYPTIAKCYARTWLPFDLLVVVPLWLVAFTGADSSAKSTSLVKYARMLRFMRLARVAKMEHYLNEAIGNLNSSLLLLVVGMAKLVIVLLVIVHLIACLWYAVGNDGSNGWAVAYSKKELFYQYLCACHWSFSQFQGTSDLLPGDENMMERAVAVLTIMCALIILSTFVSSLTNIIMQMQSLSSEARQLDNAVRLFLSSNDISWHLSLRVKKYLCWKQRLERKLGGFSKVIEILPRAMQADLQEEVRGPQISSHRLFLSLKDIHPRMFRDICYEALRPYSPAPGEVIFNMNESSFCMYFIIDGDYRYVVPVARGATKHERGYGYQPFEEDAVDNLSAEIIGIKRQGQLNNNLEQAKGPGESTHERDEGRTTVYIVGKGKHLSEASLWTDWDHCGICLASKRSEHMTMHREEFARLARANPPAHCSLILYARSFMAGLNTFGKHFTDMIELQDLLQHDRDSVKREYNNRKSSLMRGTISGKSIGRNVKSKKRGNSTMSSQ